MSIGWTVAFILGMIGAVFIGYGLKLQLIVRPSESNLERYLDELTSKLQNRIKERDKVEKQRAKLKKNRAATPTAEDEQVGWCIEDYDWRYDDLDWTVQDLEANIRNTRFEMLARKNMETTSKATFWTVLGASAFSLAGLILGILAIQ
jgi:hypothetical protein